MDPDIVPSNVYAMALRSVLGDSEERHPMELMLDQQRSDIEEIENALLEARQRLSSTESRLPGELARADWLRNLIGKDGLEQMKRLRTFLFFDAKYNVWATSPIDLHGSTSLYSRPRNGKEALQQYRELVAMYESTKRGPVAGNHFEVKQHYHPEHLLSAEGDFDCCDNHYNHPCESHGTNLCDDLKYRCDECWDERQLMHKGLNLKAEKIPVLKPHWEVEALTQEQVALVEAVGDSNGRIKLQTGVGYLKQEQQAFEILRKKAIIKWAMESWSRLYPEESSTLETLADERMTRGLCRIADAEECHRCAQMGVQHLEFSWYGLPGNNHSYRSKMLKMMTRDERGWYDADLADHHRIAMSKGQMVSEEVKRGEEGGSQWPYAPLEDSYTDEHQLYSLDEEDICDNESVDYGDVIFGSQELTILVAAINKDRNALSLIQ